MNKESWGGWTIGLLIAGFIFPLLWVFFFFALLGWLSSDSENQDVKEVPAIVKRGVGVDCCCSNCEGEIVVMTKKSEIKEGVSIVCPYCDSNEDLDEISIMNKKSKKQKITNIVNSKDATAKSQSAIKEDMSYVRSTEEYMSQEKAQKTNSNIEIDVRKDSLSQEVLDFHSRIRKIKSKKLEDPNIGARISESNFDFFQGFIQNTKKELLITTNVFSDKDLIELLAPIRNSKIKVKIITAREKDKQYNIEKFFSKNKLDINILSCQKNHSKIIIRDSEKMIVGSSNLDSFSLNRALETNIVVENKDSILEAESVINSILKKGDFRKVHRLSNFTYSGKKEDGLPSIVENLIKKETARLSVLMPLQLFDIQILNKIKDWNINNVPIYLYFSDRYAKGKNNQISKQTYLFLKNKVYGKNINIRFTRETVHSKVYLFESQKKSLISSLNMTVNSWNSMLESGVVSSATLDYSNILERIYLLSDSNLILNGNFTSVENLPMVWSQSPNDTKKLTIPWLSEWSNDNLGFDKKTERIYFPKQSPVSHRSSTSIEKNYDEKIIKKKIELPHYEGDEEKILDIFKHLKEERESKEKIDE